MVHFVVSLYTFFFYKIIYKNNNLTRLKFAQVRIKNKLRTIEARLQMQM